MNMSTALIECVPNFSEGSNPAILQSIARAIEQVPGVHLLDMDPGKSTNRTVFTFVGAPEVVIEAAFRAIKTASECIDMRTHTGEHPRMGATDVCPLIPISGISMEETAAWAHRLGKRVGAELEIPIYMYEAAATSSQRKNLADIRSGEYEGLAAKLQDPVWKPDYGPARFHAQAGATVIGARDFLIAYNANLNTTSERRANAVAFDVREQGRIIREGDPIAGKPKLDAGGEPLRTPGMCPGVKGIGWFIEEYGYAQVSMNITDIHKTPLHMAWEACCQSAEKRGMRVTGSEIVGLVPLKVMTDAGRYFLKKQQRTLGVSEAELIRIAIQTMHLNESTPFDPQKKIIEYRMKDIRKGDLADMTLRKFLSETASEKPAPGGGSISAAVGAFGAALGVMVANLSSHKRGWDDRWEYFSNYAETGYQIQEELTLLINEDTQAFVRLMEAFKLPKESDADKKVRSETIQQATMNAVEVPLRTMRACMKSWPLIETMIKEGNPNSVTDAGVGALCLMTAIRGASFNVRVNLAGIKDEAWKAAIIQEVNEILSAGGEIEKRCLQQMNLVLNG